MIVCGIHYDNSRLFELLRAANANPKLAAIPFVCVRLLGSNLAPALIQTWKSPAARSRQFLDLYVLERSLGLEKAESELGRILLALANSPTHSDRMR